jgi:hypothetical protein
MSLSQNASEPEIRGEGTGDIIIYSHFHFTPQIILKMLESGKVNSQQRRGPRT